MIDALGKDVELKGIKQIIADGKIFILNIEARTQTQLIIFTHSWEVAHKKEDKQTIVS